MGRVGRRSDPVLMSLVRPKRGSDSGREPSWVPRDVSGSRDY